MSTGTTPEDGAVQLLTARIVGHLRRKLPVLGSPHMAGADLAVWRP